jgi:hypothetical protein
VCGRRHRGALANPATAQRVNRSIAGVRISGPWFDGLIEVQHRLEVRRDSNPVAQGAPMLKRLRNVAMMEVWSKG